MGFMRQSGVLLPVSSLPSPYGIGTFGKEAYKFVDKLSKAGQSYWQVLPLGPTSYGDSPYQSPSAFAGNPYFIDIDELIDEGLITKKEAKNMYYGGSEEYVDYAAVYENRYPLLKKAFDSWKNNIPDDFYDFLNQEAEWLLDYALFMAVKNYFNQAEWSRWDEDIRFRKPEAVERYKELLAEDIQFYEFLQYRFYKAWFALKKYANDKGIRIIGDMPIYVSYDSADVWVNTRLFRLDDRLLQTEVAGCPPDAFSEDGQKWGNPLYAWNVHEADDFAWFRKRMKALARLYDVIRIDHFIGIVRYYCIPHDKSAKYGWYENGPSLKLTKAIKEAVGDSDVIAEDLGVLTDEVVKVLNQTGFPGMKVLEFAFGSDEKNDHLPHNLKRNCVLYLGTHDNEPLDAYIATRQKEELKHIKEYLGVRSKSDIHNAMIVELFKSVADTAIIQMQDVLSLGMEARMNLPSTLGNNWKWRMKKGAFGNREISKLARLTKLYGRNNI